MNLKNLSAINKTHRKTLDYLKNKKILKIFKEFSISLDVKQDIAVAVSGGPDSLALAFLSKCYALKNKIQVKCFIVDHKLRKESSSEAKNVKDILKKNNIYSKILVWNGKKPFRNIQSLARDKRYSLLANECKKNNIQNLLLGHHRDDMFENFFIRIVRGSGLKGLVSFSKRTKYKDKNLDIFRPLLNLEKQDLVYISKEVFNFYVKDPSNVNLDYKRTRIRNLLYALEKEGLDKKKLILTIDNLKDTDDSIKFYVNKNLQKNVIFFKKKNICIIGKDFFEQSHEIIFRSLTELIQKIGKKYYAARGKSINKLIEGIDKKTFTRASLGGCFVDKINGTILISKESSHKI
jgi:tRNA(Ile)-lysidine synthase